MSRFFSEKYSRLKAYVPGEQPQERPFIKLNTNESPYPPLPEVALAVAAEAERLNLYSDPESRALRTLLAERLEVGPENLLMTNGSDEILNFAFMAFCDDAHPAVFADVTYGFYPVFAAIDQVPWREIPLREDLTLDPADYACAGGTIFIANPNAPTALALSREEIRRILEANRDQVVVIDEAYVDFGAESCVPLIREYDNLLVTQTFSKSRSLAGLRLGFGVACEALIQDLKTVQYSTNPYNVDRLASAAGVACLKQDGYNLDNARTIAETRGWTAARLREMGFEMTDSRTNFLFARHAAFPGDSLYRLLRERGILIRHFSVERIRDWNRITIGTREQMETLVETVAALLKEKSGVRFCEE